MDAQWLAINVQAYLAWVSNAGSLTQTKAVLVSGAIASKVRYESKKGISQFCSTLSSKTYVI